eukprot:gnl/TRDRNA2_/TRDRNA2_195560_c0_seq2.p1 gnl/TRDRNA2_/TRDRNA2_195560_c0~~gnl/TRDRNA2_/TRDRNA2_195560_c0_seq2.p1  ORF type:complete len:366 (-),score=41.67 gnl/TRDRNA2_/TRDRNA2_195560_c0_seq2:34-972(-)
MDTQEMKVPQSSQKQIEADAAFARSLQALEDSKVLRNSAVSRCRRGSAVIDVEESPPRKRACGGNWRLKPGSSVIDVELDSCSQEEVQVTSSMQPLPVEGRSAASCSSLSVESYGTIDEPIFCVRNVDGNRGATVKEILLADMRQAGMPVPEPQGNKKRAAIIIEKLHNKRTKYPWRTGLRSEDLNALATKLLDTLYQSHPDVPLLWSRYRGWNDTEVLVYNAGCKVGRHRDAQPQGSLLLIFCAGLASVSKAWPGGREITMRLESGDVMIFDGKTEHSVPRCGIPDTSPFPHDPWLGRRRLAVLVRQSPPT